MNTQAEVATTWVIPDTEYDNWVNNWKEREYSPEVYTFFELGKDLQTGVTFDFDVISYLLSTPGLATVKIRFGLYQPDNQPPRFHLILFGADKDNRIITPYFTSAAFSKADQSQIEAASKGNLPQALMRRWENAWREQVKKRHVTHAMFKTRDGFLQGYNYPMQEVMQALGAFKGAANIHIRFGLHEYYDMYETADSALRTIYTFGLILYASKRAKSADNGDGTDGVGVVEDSGYYDLTAPCPRTC